MIKACYIDLETTSINIDFKKDGIWQIFGLLVVDGVEKESFNFKVKPFPDDIIMEESLAIGGVMKEDLRRFEAPPQVYQKLLRFLGKYVDKYNRSDKYHFIGYNAMFDYNRLRSFFEKNQDKFFGSWFYFPPLDVMNLVAWKFAEERQHFSSFKQMDVAKYLGIEIEESKLHDAEYDIALTREIVKIVMEGQK